MSVPLKLNNGGDPAIQTVNPGAIEILHRVQFKFCVSSWSLLLYEIYGSLTYALLLLIVLYSVQNGVIHLDVESISMCWKMDTNAIILPQILAALACPQIHAALVPIISANVILIEVCLINKVVVITLVVWKELLPLLLVLVNFNAASWIVATLAIHVWTVCAAIVVKQYALYPMKHAASAFLTDHFGVIISLVSVV